MKDTAKRKLISGTIELVIGVAILIYSLVTGANLYLYGALVFIGSGVFTLAISGLKMYMDKKQANKLTVVENKEQPKEEIIEQ